MSDDEERLRRASRQERIRQRASELWERVGRPFGRDDEFWYQAENEIDAEDAGAKD